MIIMELTEILRHISMAGSEKLGGQVEPKTQSFLNYDDALMVKEWLDYFADSPETYRAYQREGERILAWCTVYLHKSFMSLKHEDFSEYERFLMNPTPTDVWCGIKMARVLGRKQAEKIIHDKSPLYSRLQRKEIADVLSIYKGELIPNPLWRPFQMKPSGQCGMSSQSVSRVLTIINNLFSYLVGVGYLNANPMSLLSRRNKTTSGGPEISPQRTRHIEELLWSCVMKGVDELPKQNTMQRARYERTLFVMSAYYHLGARLSELNYDSGGYVRHLPENSGFVWQIGNSGKFIPINAELLTALARYRDSLGLSPIPLPTEKEPFVRDLHGNKAIKSRQIYNIIKKALSIGADIAKHMGLSQEDVQLLRNASPGSIRKGFIVSLMLSNIDPVTALSMVRLEKFPNHTSLIPVSTDELQKVIERISTKSNPMHRGR